MTMMMQTENSLKKKPHRRPSDVLAVATNRSICRDDCRRGNRIRLGVVDGTVRDDRQ